MTPAPHPETGTEPQWPLVLMLCVLAVLTALALVAMGLANA